MNYKCLSCGALISVDGVLRATRYETMEALRQKVNAHRCGDQLAARDAFFRVLNMGAEQ